MIGAIIGAIVAGLVIGALGRLILPGKQNISILMTIVIGIVASLAATFILGSLFGYENDNGGVQWWYWIVGAILAALASCSTAGCPGGLCDYRPSSVLRFAEDPARWPGPRVFHRSRDRGDDLLSRSEGR